MLTIGSPVGYTASQLRAGIKHKCYDYVRKTYGVDPRIGQRVRHTITGHLGTVVISRTSLHYVRVVFDGERRRAFCHPTELDYQP